MGCGKSTAARLFHERGIPSIDTDRIVRDLLASDADIHQALRGKFGEEIFGADRGVHRPALGKRVFNDAEALQWLEDLLHPRVHTIWQDFLQNHCKTTALVEIPLLFENKLEKHFDYTVCVDTSEARQMDRLGDRGLAASEAQARIQRQLPLAEKRGRADKVLSNTGSVEFLGRQIDYLLAQLAKAS